MKAWIGADPGGKENFGIAVLREDGSCSTDAVSSVDEAVKLLKVLLGNVRPECAGIDAPLWWSSGEKGLRRADERIRLHYKMQSRHVQAVNSMWGAVLVQGILLAHLLRAAYPAMAVTETHPKAIVRGWRKGDRASLLKGLRLDAGCEGSDHRVDAAISALAAREGVTGQWPEDLFSDRSELENNPSSTWVTGLHYFWPERLTRVP